MTTPDRPLPPEDFDGCTCDWFATTEGEYRYSDPDCAVHAPRYLLTLDPDERSDR